jgi:hypothetical protein
MRHILIVLEKQFAETLLEPWTSRTRSWAALFVVLFHGAWKGRQLISRGNNKIQIDSEFVFPIDSISEFQL